MSRLQPLDRALLLLIGSVWVVGFALHAVNAARGRLAEPSVYVSAPESPAGFPVVRSLRVGAPAKTSGLEPGDELLRIGGRDLKGVGPIGFFAIAMEQMGPDQRARVTYRRHEESRDLWLEYTPLPLPIRFILLSLSFAVTAFLLAARAPRNREATALFRGTLLFSLAFLRPWGGPVLQTYLWAAVILSLSPLLPPLLIFAARGFREERPRGFFASAWPWFFVPLGFIYLSGIFGIPLLGVESNLADPISMAMLFLLGTTIVVEFTISYRRSSPIGRRQIKWIVYGLYLSLVPVLIATVVSLSNPELWWLSDASEILEVLIPITVFVAIVRYGIFDIDRIISATASYSALIIVGAPLALTLAPALADAVSQVFGIQPWPGRVALSIGLALAAIPVHRHLNPRIDRWFFPDRHAFEEEVLELLEELPRLESPTELAMRVSVRIDELLRPESCASFIRIRSAEGYANVFARGRAVPPMFDDQNPVIAVLRDHGKPLAAERWSKLHKGTVLSSFDRAALESLDAAVLVPVRQRGDLLGFTCLGPKRSGDLYTATDLALLASIGNRVGAELVRFDATELIRQGEEMQAALRRYVPGAVVDELDTKTEIRSAERHVSVLFVDIRGYTSYAESRGAEEIFSMVSRYTEIVSDIVRRHAGSVVEFNGDGLMAVFGAPNELAFKERSAIDAGRAILEAVGSLHVEVAEGTSAPLAVGVGVATGEAFVGNIRAVDRLIWTAIGNTTNRAARLESMTRELAASMAIDEATWLGAKASCADFAKCPRVRIRGYTEPIDLYVLPLPGK